MTSFEHVAASLVDRSGVLLDLGSTARIDWNGPIRGPAEVGPLCTRGLDRVTILISGSEWRRAFSVLAMFKSVQPSGCLVLADDLPPLHLVPCDGQVAVIGPGRRDPNRRGAAAFQCADLRSDRIFRLMLAGRVLRQPQLAALPGLHELAQTPYGRTVLDRWCDVIPELFRAGLKGKMPADLRADLEGLAAAARQGEHAIIGGFHALDPVVRGAADWQAGAETYLRLAARQSPAALDAIGRWFSSRSDWALASPSRQEELRLTAARLLHALVDDPWPSERRLAKLFPADHGR